MTNDNQYDNPLEEVEKQEVDEVLVKLGRKIKTKWQDVSIDPTELLDPSKPFTPPDWAISIHGTNVFAFDDYNYLQGQAGNGKTFTMCIYESVILGAQFGDLRYVGKHEQPKILHVDTEQSEGNVQLHMRRVYHLAGWDQGSDHRDQYRMLMLRETPSPSERLAKVVKYCYEYRPNFLFLDGMLDVVEGMNKEEDCNQVISEVGALASVLNMCVVGICHENPTNPKAKDEGGPPKPAGHIGSYSQRKGSAGQGTVKTLNGTDALFKVTAKKVRNKDYEGWSFGVKDATIRIDGADYQIGIPYWIDAEGNYEVEEEEDPLKGAVLKAVSNLQWGIDGMSYTEFEKALKGYGITSKRKLGDYISLSKTYGFVVQNPDTKRYYLVYSANTEIDTQTKIDNNSLGDSDDKPPF